MTQSESVTHWYFWGVSRYLPVPDFGPHSTTIHHPPPPNIRLTAHPPAKKSCISHCTLPEDYQLNLHHAYHLRLLIGNVFSCICVSCSRRGHGSLFYIFVHDNSWQSPHQIAESATGLLGLFVDPVRLRGRVSSMRTRFWTPLMVKVIHAYYELP